MRKKTADKKNLLFFPILFPISLFLFAATYTVNNTSLCGSGKYKSYGWGDSDKQLEMSWDQTIGYKCQNGIESVTFSIKAGPRYHQDNSCYDTYFDQEVWRVQENWEGNNKGPECKDISHVVVNWNCRCPEPTPTPTPEPQATPTSSLYITPSPTPIGNQDENPTNTPTPPSELYPTNTPHPTSISTPTPFPTSHEL